MAAQTGNRQRPGRAESGPEKRHMIHERHASAQLPSVCVSGVEFSRDARDILGGSDGVRTMAFSTTVRTVRQGSFSGAESLSSMILNEGLEVLGTDERKPDGEIYSGVFQESGLRHVRLPSTLKRIECDTFSDCKRLWSIRLPEELEHIGTKASRKACWSRSSFRMR